MKVLSSHGGKTKFFLCHLKLEEILPVRSGAGKNKARMVFSAERKESHESHCGERRNSFRERSQEPHRTE
jgi:hypothetical protein